MKKNIIVNIVLSTLIFFVIDYAYGAGKITIVDDAKRNVQTPANPKRIVVLNSSNLEMLYAVGGTAVGRPESTGMPTYLASKVKNLPSVGETPNPNIERIVSLSPDLVIGVNVAFHHTMIPAMEKAEIPVLLLSLNSYQDILDKLKLYGEITGNEEKAKKVIDNIQTRVNETAKKARDHMPSKVVIIWGSTESFNMVLPNSFVGNLIEILGGVNIASGLKPIQSMPQYATINMEYILAKDPDMVLLITHGYDDKVSAKFKKEIQRHPAWKGLKAVREGKVYTLPYGLFGVNPAVRVADAIDHLAKLMYNTTAKTKGKR